jgi:hypothetical protein
VRKAAKVCGISKNTTLLWRYLLLVAAAKHGATHETGAVWPGRDHIQVMVVVRDRKGDGTDFKLA